MISELVNASACFSIIMSENLDYLLEKNIITEKEKSLIEEYQERLSSNNVPIIYNLRHLRKLLNIKKKDQNRLFGKERYQSYRNFTIPKKNGDPRQIEAPVEDLKSMQLWIKENILDKFIPSVYAKGFRKGVSIVDNATPHIGKELIINVDISDFFPSIKYYDIYKIFKYIGYTNEVSHLLTKLCTNHINVLPQGSPASPSISNLITLKLDKRLSKLAEKWNCSYTRYADDITFSGSKNTRKVLPIIMEIINQEGFEVNENKIRLKASSQRQEVTGLVVNDKLSVSSKLIREIENAIYYCKRYGVVSHMRKIGCNKSFYKEHLYGIAYFVKMIDSEKGLNYLKQLNEIVWN